MKKSWWCVVLLAGLAVGAPFNIARADTLTDWHSHFIELPMESRQLTGPLFWLHGDESEQKLRDYVAIVAEGGNGCFTAESRPHNDWLGEGWYRDLAICLDAAKKHNLKMWIFDEKWWPSQGVAGQVSPRYATKMLVAQAEEVTGPKQYTAPGFGGERYIAAIAGKITADGKVDGDSLIDLAKFIRNGQLSWQIPSGPWRIMKFTHKQGPPLGQNGQLSVDGASQDCVDWFIQTVYQPHYDRFKEDFGTWIPGFFYDEPETRGDWGTELNKTLAEWGVDWKKAYVAYKFELNGPDQTAARYQYLDAFAETWGRTMYGSITNWCHQHGVVSIGHFMEHGYLYRNLMFCAGDMIRLQKYSDMGGIDAVFSQFAMGKRVTNDVPTWMTPKLASSISHAYGKKDDLAMVEIFGARGQNLTYPEMKWWTDHMQVCGVNFHIPHSFNPRSPYDTDCPPYFYNSGEEPRWPLYRVYADYTARLSMMLSGGRHVCPVALLFVGNSYNVGKAVMPEQISESLQDALFDFDWLPREVFEKDAKIDSGHLLLYQERYRILIVPPIEVIPYETLLKVKAFWQQGGIVVGYDFLPSRPATLGRNNGDIESLCRVIWGNATPGLNVCQTNAAGGRSYLLPANPTPEQIQQVLTTDAGIHPTLEVLSGETGHWLHALHRIKDNRDIFFICNQNVDDTRRNFRFRITAPGYPERWDALRGEISSIPFKRQGDTVELDMVLESNESVLLVFAAQKRKLESLEEKSRQKIPVIRREVSVADNKVKDDQTQVDPLRGCQWIWKPGGDPASQVEPGACYFRKSFQIPSGQKITEARFLGTADNQLTLWINGRLIAADSNIMNTWAALADLDVTDFIHPGRNVAAIEAVNGADNSNPAGLIGKFIVSLPGQTIVIPLDAGCRVSTQKSSRWESPDFNDSRWQTAFAFADYGTQPWGLLSAKRRTYSPVDRADPFMGDFELSEGQSRYHSRFILEMDSVPVEAAARITVNGHYAGGFIGKPYQLDITQHVTSGNNTLRIEPFAPDDVRVAVYPIQED